MSDVVAAAVEALNEKLGGNGFDGIAKFEIEYEGAIVIDEGGARASDDAADVTLSASADTFQDILAGNLVLLSGLPGHRPPTAKLIRR